MIAAILAGGYGTRLQEHTTVVPKPMVEIGGRPIIWHIMKTYAEFGVDRFAVALGYKGSVIKEFFVNYARQMNSIRVDLHMGTVDILERQHERWTVDLLDTGMSAQTGARLARMKDLLGKETFFLTYGDGVSDVNIGELLEFHRHMGRAVTLTAVRPPARFGALHIENGAVDRFMEKPKEDGGWINGGFMVCEPRIFDYLNSDDECVLEREPMERLAADGQLAAYQHPGFWQSMDTVRDMQLLNETWNAGSPPWKRWKD